MSVPKVRIKWTATKDKRLIKLRTSDLSWEEIGEKFEIAGESARSRYKILKREQRQGDHPLGGFTRDAIGDIIKKRRLKDGMFFISSAQPVMDEASPDTEWIIGENLHEPFFKSILSFCKKNSAELVILPTRGHVKALSDQPAHFSSILEPYLDTNFATEFKFNKYLTAMDLRINPQQQDPLTNISSIGTKDNRKGSLIVASPKQMLQVKATGNESSPRILASTGSITVPQYLNNRIGRIAESRHVVGGLVVTIIGNRFLVHQVQCKNVEGSFNWLGTRYFADGSTKEERAEAMKLGDVHAGYHNKTALEATYEQLATLRPKKVFLEDVFDGTSVSHHLEKDLVSRSMLPENFRTLENEIAACKELMEEIWTYTPEDCEVYLTDANHPDFVNRYLKAGRYIKDVQNFGIAHDMVGELRRGLNPLKLRLDPNDIFTWLDINDDLHVEGVQMACHGHSAGAARGSIKNMESIYGDIFTGHSHSPGIHYNSYQVGHLSQDRHGYNLGPSNWAHCNGCVYQYGEKSLMFIIDGEWC